MALPDPRTRSVEDWFLSRGIPHFIEDDSPTRDVFTRTLPMLTIVIVLELIGALNFLWAWWVNLGVAAAGLAALLGVWTGSNALRHRPLLARPDRVGPPELAVFVLAPAVLPLVAGGQWSTALNTAAGNLVLLGRQVALTTELLRVAGFLTAFSGFYFTVYMLTDATYRHERLDDVLGEMRQSLAVRAVYLGALGRPADGAPAEAGPAGDV